MQVGRDFALTPVLAVVKGTHHETVEGIDICSRGINDVLGLLCFSFIADFIGRDAARVCFCVNIRIPHTAPEIGGSKQNIGIRESFGQAFDTFKIGGYQFNAFFFP